MQNAIVEAEKLEATLLNVPWYAFASGYLREAGGSSIVGR